MSIALASIKGTRALLATVDGKGVASFPAHLNGGNVPSIDAVAGLLAVAPTVNFVYCTPNANGSARYTAVMSDGSQVVIRKAATTVYPFAFLHSRPVQKKYYGKPAELAGLFSFGRFAAEPDTLVRVFAVQKAGSL